MTHSRHIILIDLCLDGLLHLREALTFLKWVERGISDTLSLAIQLIIRLSKLLKDLTLPLQQVGLHGSNIVALDKTSLSFLNLRCLLLNTFPEGSVLRVTFPLLRQFEYIGCQQVAMDILALSEALR